MTAVLYCTPEEVGAMASTWSRNGLWYDAVPDGDPPVEATNPSLTQVNTWIETVSGQMNLALETYRFVVPVVKATSPNAYLSISQYVCQLVADLCNFKNSSGRFFSQNLVERGVTPMKAILTDLNAWVAEYETGLVADHVPQTGVEIPHKQVRIRVLGNFPSR